MRDYFLLEGSTPFRAARLAQLLVKNGIEVRRVKVELHAKASSATDGETVERLIPAGSYHISLAQPGGRLARILLEQHIDMGGDFVKRQLDRLSRRLSDEIYDVTAWSLPLAFGVTCFSTHGDVAVESEVVSDPKARGEVIGGPAKLAYLVSGEDDAVPMA